MIIALDTNTIVADFLLTGTQFRVLLEAGVRVGFRLAVPEVVLLEAVRRYSETLVTELTTRDHAERRVEQLIIPARRIAPPTIDVADHVASYEAYLRQAFRDAGATVLPIPNVPLPSIVARDLARKKPFGGANGYRDFLIWLSVVEGVAKASLPGVFVTDNIKDFAAESGIHPDLLADLEQRGVKPEQFVHMRSVREVNERFVLPKLQAAGHATGSQGWSGRLGVDLYSWVESTLGDMVPSDEILSLLLDVEPGVGNAHSPELDGPLVIELEEAVETSPGARAVTFSVRAPVKVHVSFTYDDFIQSARVREILGDDDPEPFSWASMEEAGRLFMRVEALIAGTPPVIEVWNVLDLERA